MTSKWIENHSLLVTTLSKLIDEPRNMSVAAIRTGGSKTLSIKPIHPLPISFAARQGSVQYPDLFVLMLTSVNLRGRDTIFSDGIPTFFEGFQPRYAHTFYEVKQDSSELSMLNEIKLEFPVVCISHWTLGTYGHFLLEMLPKISVFFNLKALLPNLKLVISNFCGDSILNIVKLFVDERDIIIYDHKCEYIHADILMVISETIVQGAIHPYVEEMCQIAIAVAIKNGYARHPNRRLFLSKGKWRSSRLDYRSLENENEISSFLSEIGFEVFYPEQSHWLEQVLTFAGAEVVVGEFTSALHNCIFSGLGTKVISLNYVNEIQDCIAAFRGHELGYILPTDGRPRKWDKQSSNKLDSFNISLASLRITLIAARIL